MRRAIVIVTAAMITAIAAAAAAVGPVRPAAQAGHGQAPGSPSLVDVAKAEEARRKKVIKPAKVYTNRELKGDSSPSVPSVPATPATPETASNTSPAITIPDGSTSAVAAVPRDEPYWRGRISAARTAFDRSWLFASALQSRINALATDFVNRDDPIQRAQIDSDRKTALAELERVKKEMEAHRQEIAAIEDEARRADVPAGWLRSGA